MDVANDDYVFAANVVTELSPIMFYMKYAGMSSKKILNFVNQPAIRLYTKNLAMYQNKFVKLNGIGNDTSARRLAMSLTLKEFENVWVYFQFAVRFITVKLLSSDEKKFIRILI